MSQRVGKFGEGSQWEEEKTLGLEEFGGDDVIDVEGDVWRQTPKIRVPEMDWLISVF